MKMLKLIAFIALIFHGQSMIAMQALKAKQATISHERAGMVEPAKPTVEAEIAKIESITQEDEREEFFQEINHEISNEATEISRKIVMEELKGQLHELLMPTITHLRDQIIANASKVATSNRTKIIDARSKIKLLCYVYQMFLNIDQGQNTYSLEEKKKKKAEIWSIVTSAGIKDPMPAQNNVAGTSTILQIARTLPMYQEIANVGAHLPQVTTKKELELMIKNLEAPIKQAYNAATKDKQNPCGVYDYLLEQFNDLASATKSIVRYGLEQSKFKIELLIAFKFLYAEINSGDCFRDQAGEIVSMEQRGTKSNELKDALWERLKKAMKTSRDVPDIQGKRPDIPGPNWVLNILRQRSDPETRAFTNPIFKRPQ